MKYTVVYLWTSAFKRITELFSSLGKGFTIIFSKNCQLKIINYLDSFCQREDVAKIGKFYEINQSVDFSINVNSGLFILVRFSP